MKMGTMKALMEYKEGTLTAPSGSTVYYRYALPIDTAGVYNLTLWDDNSSWPLKRMAVRRRDLWFTNPDTAATGKPTR